MTRAQKRHAVAIGCLAEAARLALGRDAEGRPILLPAHALALEVALDHFDDTAQLVIEEAEAHGAALVEAAATAGRGDVVRTVTAYALVVGGGRR